MAGATGEEKPRLSTEGMKSAPVAEAQECLRLRLDSGDIVVANECSYTLHLEAIEARYYVYGLPVLRGRDEPRRVRRLVTERIAVGEELPPRGSVRVFFGSTESLVEVYAYVRKGSETLRVKLL